MLVSQIFKPPIKRFGQCKIMKAAPQDISGHYKIKLASELCRYRANCKRVIRFNNKLNSLQMYDTEQNYRVLHRVAQR
jgi:hypothetical protein